MTPSPDLKSRQPPPRRPAPRWSAAELNAEAPFVPWTQVHAYLSKQFQQGDHVAILGPTGAGKTHIGFDLLEFRKSAIVIACKKRDPLVEDALSRGYWLVPTDKLEVPYVDGRPVHRRVLYWPRVSERSLRKLPEHTRLRVQRDHQRPRVQAAFGYVDLEGHWAVMIDEGTWVCRDLGLQRDVDSALFMFRTNRSSIVMLGQRPAWMGRYVLSMPTHLFLFNTSNADDRKALGDISGVDQKMVAELVARLDFERHEVLYLDTRRRQMFRTIAPPK